MGWYEREDLAENFRGERERKKDHFPAPRRSGRRRDGAGCGGDLLHCAVSGLYGGLLHTAAAAHLLGGDCGKTLRHLLRRRVGEC